MANGTTSHEAQATDYDLAGRVIRQGVVTDSANTNTWSHAGTGIDTTSIKYNAFGEVAQRGLVHFSSGNTVSDEVLPESFDYDGAGRLWRRVEAALRAIRREPISWHEVALPDARALPAVDEQRDPGDER